MPGQRIASCLVVKSQAYRGPYTVVPQTIASWMIAKLLWGIFTRYHVHIGVFCFFLNQDVTSIYDREFVFVVSASNPGPCKHQKGSPSSRWILDLPCMHVGLCMYILTCVPLHTYVYPHWCASIADRYGVGDGDTRRIDFPKTLSRPMRSWARASEMNSNESGAIARPYLHDRYNTFPIRSNRRNI